jgi:hypothetical protein
MNNLVMIMGFVFALFLPGFFVTMIFFRHSKWLEKLLLSVTFSIMIALTIGIVLGYNKEVAQITGGISPANVWQWELFVTGFFFILALGVNYKELKPSRIKDNLTNLIAFWQDKDTHDKQNHKKP